MTEDDLLARVRAWRDDDPDESTRRTLDALLEQRSPALATLFAGALVFGTAGLRGPVGAGPLAMNRRVIRRATAGLCARLDAVVKEARTRGVVIGHDARPSSRAFAEDAARVAAGQGFVVHLFPTHAPTPVAAYALRTLHAAAALVVTASHNPREDNGLKVYWEHGGQIVPPEDAAIAACMDAVERVLELPLADLATSPLVRAVPASLVDRYRDDVLTLVPRATRTLRIAYTPLHGVGGALALDLLARAGFADVHVVASQAEPDGTFPTAAFPNPEEPQAMRAVLALMEDVSADIALANDPDADRLAAAIRTPSGVRVLDGNEIGALLTDARLRVTTAAKPLVIATLVSSPFVHALAHARGARYEQTLTGHKWIHDRARKLEAEGYELVLGYEEALGYAVSSLVRDKDGLSALLVLAAAADEAKARGETLEDVLDALAREVGLFVSRSFSLRSEAGLDVLREKMESIRDDPPDALGAARVIAFTDVREGRRRTEKFVETIALPRSDVLVLELAPEGRVMIRPSGTEPKLKVYFDVREPVHGHETIAAARVRANARLDALVEETKALLAD